MTSRLCIKSDRTMTEFCHTVALSQYKTQFLWRWCIETVLRNRHDDDELRATVSFPDGTVPHTNAKPEILMKHHDDEVGQATVRCPISTAPNARAKLHELEWNCTWPKWWVQVSMNDKTGLNFYWQSYDHALYDDAFTSASHARRSLILIDSLALDTNKLIICKVPRQRLQTYMV